MKSKISVILVLIFFSGLGCALKKDVVTLDNRVGELRLRVVTAENDISRLKSRSEEIAKLTDELTAIGEEKEKNLRGLTAGQLAEIEALKEKIQILSGKLEETDHLLKQKLRILEETDKKMDGRLTGTEEISGAYKERIVRLEQYLSLDSREKTTTPVPVAGTYEKKEGTEDEIYTSATRLYDGGKYAAAREMFQEMLTKYPDSDKADNCQFWIGESFYQEKWYEKAIVEYQKVIEKYPNGNKLQASLLKQGLSFYSLGDKVNAKLVLNELIQKYPKSNEAKIAARNLKGFN
ncbi:MAG: tol-pal system protein YbgF [Desulfobacteraceae bacterium]|nr:MAG: tol-pal system protein YbgF [Desulfobacteraceae bacterium]